MFEKNMKNVIEILINKIRKEELSLEEHQAIINNESINYHILNYIIKKKKENKDPISDNVVKEMLNQRLSNHLMFKVELIAISVLYCFFDILTILNYEEYKEDYEKSLRFFDKLEEIKILLNMENKNFNAYIFNHYIAKNKQICEELKKQHVIEKNMLFNNHIKKYDIEYYNEILNSKNGNYSCEDICRNEELFLEKIKDLNHYKEKEKLEIYIKYINLIIENNEFYELLEKRIIFEALYNTDKKINDTIIEEIIKKENELSNEKLIYKYHGYNSNLLNFLNVEKIKDINIAIKCTFKERNGSIFLKNILSKYQVEQKKLIKLINEIQRSELNKYDIQLKMLTDLVDNKNNIIKVLYENPNVAINYVYDIKLNKNIATKLMIYCFQEKEIDINKAKNLIKSCVEKNIKIQWKQVVEDMYYNVEELIYFAIEHDKNILKINFLEIFSNYQEILKRFFDKKDFLLDESYLDIDNKYIKEKRNKIYEFYKNFKNIQQF